MGKRRRSLSPDVRSSSRPARREPAPTPAALADLFVLPELFLHVLSFLTPAELARVQLVSRHWERVAGDPGLWRRLYLGELGRILWVLIGGCGRCARAEGKLEESQSCIGVLLEGSHCADLRRESEPVLRLSVSADSPERYSHPHHTVYRPSRPRPIARMPSRAFPPPSPSPTRSRSPGPAPGSGSRSGSGAVSGVLSFAESERQADADTDTSAARFDGVDWKAMLRLGTNW
jgi:hypothetical protein